MVLLEELAPLAPPAPARAPAAAKYGQALSTEELRAEVERLRAAAAALSRAPPAHLDDVDEDTPPEEDSGNGAFGGCVRRPCVTSHVARLTPRAQPAARRGLPAVRPGRGDAHAADVHERRHV